VTDAANPQTFRDLDEQRLVIDIDDLLGWHLGDVQRKAKDVRVGFAKVDKAGDSDRRPSRPMPGIDGPTRW
jgi:hypothetical protein